MSNQIEIYTILKEEYGFNNAFICGALANIQKESSYSPKNLQNTSNKKLGITDDEYVRRVDSGEYDRTFFKKAMGFGLIQWTSSGRKGKLYDFAKKKGASIGDLRMQIDFFVTELKGSYKKVYKQLMKLPDTSEGAYEAAYTLCYKYEVPANKAKSSVSRGKLAQELYKTFGVPCSVTVNAENKITAKNVVNKLKELGYKASIN